MKTNHLITAFALGMLTIAGCKKEQQQTTHEKTYNDVKGEVARLEDQYKNRKVTRAVLPGSLSWPIGSSVPIPVLTKFYYCTSTASPLGTGYIRYHYQVDLDATTKTYLCNNRASRRLELRFATTTSDPSPLGGWKYYTRTGLSACADWPRCFFVDYPIGAGPVTIPNLVIASIVADTAGSNYTTGGSASSYGWNGIFSFTTPPTFSIYQSYQMDMYPGTTPPCP